MKEVRITTNIIEKVDLAAKPVKAIGCEPKSCCKNNQPVIFGELQRDILQDKKLDDLTKKISGIKAIEYINLVAISGQISEDDYSCIFNNPAAGIIWNNIYFRLGQKTSDSLIYISVSQNPTSIIYEIKINPENRFYEISKADLTTSISVNKELYHQVAGIITLPDYPEDSLRIFDAINQAEDFAKTSSEAFVGQLVYVREYINHIGQHFVIKAIGEAAYLEPVVTGPKPTSLDCGVILED